MQEKWVWPFELQSKLGDGAMGEVYRARCVTNNKIVAVKLLPRELLADKTMAARFERELEVLKSLRHQNIVHCFGGKCEGKRRFYAMEVVEGGTLQDLLEKRKTLPWNEVIHFLKQMCSALAAAHGLGVVHRDLKPANFLITKDGDIKLSDFGLALVGSASKLTAAGKTMGTYYYMAPEQIRGSDDINTKTDLYALGCVLFEMLSGRPPFLGETPAEILHKHLKEPPPRISDLVKDLPQPGIADKLIGSLLEKDYRKRPENAEAVAEMIGAAVTAGKSITETAEFKKKPSRKSSQTVGSIDEETVAIQKLSIYGLSGLSALLLVVNLYLFFTREPPPLNASDSAVLQSVDLWYQAYSDKSKAKSVRAEAARALGVLGSTQEDAVKALIEGLKDNPTEVLVATIQSLGNLQEKANTAKPFLIRLQKSSDPLVRTEATNALKKIRGLN